MTEWSPIRSVIIRSEKQNWKTELDDTKSYYKFIIKITISEKQSSCISFKETLLLKWNILHFVLATVSQMLVTAVY